MSNFDWKLSTIDECAKQIMRSKEGTIKQLFAYYKRSNNVLMLDRLEKARKLSRVFKMEASIKVLREEIGTYE